MDSEQKSGTESEKKTDDQENQDERKGLEKKDEAKKVEPKPTFITQTEMLLQCYSKIELQTLVSR